MDRINRIRNKREARWKKVETARKWNGEQRTRNVE